MDAPQRRWQGRRDACTTRVVGPRLRLTVGFIVLCASLGLGAVQPSSATPASTAVDQARRAFAAPPQHYWPRPLWFWNHTRVDAETVRTQMQLARDRSKYGGFGILPFGRAFAPPYLSEEYFAVYGAALEQAEALGLTLSLYDEFGFPSGSAGSQNSSDVSLFAQRWPHLTIKRLDKHEWDVVGPGRFQTNLPSGSLAALVALNPTTFVRHELSDTVREARLDWAVPEGTWKLMVFVCVTDGDPICDYLDPEAADRFIEITHQAYYERFTRHFGTTIDSTFFDEPTLYRAQGRSWTGQFNQKFVARHGFDPRPYYPALWHDIGPQTAAARNYLFGFRTELYATGFTKRIQDWCDAHHITATGHQDQEEVINPVSVSGDLMKCFQYLAIPGIDKIGGDRPAERFYKVVSSAAYNYDRALVMSETYGAMGDLPWEEIYTVAMEQYTKGINLLIPHAVWYDDTQVTFKPELSWRDPRYADRLPEFNTFLARLNVLLQNDAAHVADLALLYPIATLQGSHHLDGPLGHYQGGVAVPEADYVDVAELLSVALGRDFTYLHPEVLDQRCVVEGNRLVLPNRLHPGRFAVLLLPGHKTIHWSSLRKIQAFYEQGGCVIATGTLPSQSAEFGHDAEVARVVEALFGTGDTAAEPATHTVRRNDRGGCAVRLRTLTAASLSGALATAGLDFDVTFEPGRTLRYIHKRWKDRHVFYFANLTPGLTGSTVTLRGRHELESWDPHTGAIEPVAGNVVRHGDTDFTRVELGLPYLKSVFLVSPVSPRPSVP
ncbi:MAG: glycosyl hydrolase [Verrucomicrobia bacterium]|nr:glycosyl hydrolase [Verrucomicrobiota bacterium]